jgi:hypothetical protein
LPFVFSNKNNDILQLCTILNNKATLLRVSFRFWGCQLGIFPNFLAIPKIINAYEA